MSKDVIELIYNYIKDKYPDVIKYITLEMIQNNSNDKNNIISLNKSGVIIEVFGAIIKSTDDVDKLYVKAINRINLGNITFN